MKRFLFSFGALVVSTLGVWGQKSAIDDFLNQNKGLIEDTWYKTLHSNPETSTKEVNTSALLKASLRDMGYGIVDSLGLYSFAGILKNGEGPVIYYRTDMDGLPIREETGAVYASKNEGAMHACGHDIHMSTWLAVAKYMASAKKEWRGTLVMIAQSAEETAQGAKRILAADNFKRLPTASLFLGFHDHAELPSGSVGFCDGYAMAAVDMMNITIFGVGGHGATPQKTIDPVLLSANFITSLQSIVSRNLDPNDPAVITVGAIQGGTVGNIIPDRVLLKLTIRSFSADSRNKILERIKTLGIHLAQSAGLPPEKTPQFDLLDMTIPSVYNDPETGRWIKSVLIKNGMENRIHSTQPVMIGEDFSIYRSIAPAYMLWLGTLDDVRKEKVKSAGGVVPLLHTARFLPDYQTAIPGGVKIMTALLLDKMKK